MEGFLVYLIYVYLFLSSFGGCALDQYVEQKADKTALCFFLRKGKGNHCNGKVTAFQPVQSILKIWNSTDWAFVFSE